MLLTDGSDLVGVERCLDIKYMKLLRKTTRMVRAWPEEELGESKSKWIKYERNFTFSLSVLMAILGITYLKQNQGKIDFLEIGQTYITLFVNFVVLSRLGILLMPSYHKLACEFVEKVHLFNFRHQSEHAMQTHILVHKMSHFYTFYLISLMYTGMCLFNLTPLFNNYKSGAFSSNGEILLEHSVYFAIPFDCRTNLKGYLIVFFYNWYLSFVVSISVCLLDLMLSLMVFHLWGHLRIIANNLENFPLPSNLEAGSSGEYRYSQEEMDKVFLMLKNNIVHYQLVANFTSRLSQTFGLMVVVYYSYHQVSGCLLLLECSQMEPEALIRYGPLTLITFQQLIQMSIVFELLASINEKIVEAVYNVPWEYMDTKNRKIVYLLLMQAQIPKDFKALDMVDVGIRTMAQILKTTFSYFLMLKTIANT